MSAPGTQPETPGYYGGAPHAVSSPVKDVSAPGAPAPGSAPPAPPAGATVGGAPKGHAPTPAAVPHRWTRLGLLTAALACALATIIAQGVLMNHAVRSPGLYFDYPVKGRDVARAPGLVIATAVLSLVLAGALIALLFFPVACCMPRAAAHSVASASMWASAVEVALVASLVVLWLASMGVAARTADVLSGSGWPKTWVSSNGAALAFAIFSLLLWAAILALSILALLRALEAWKGHRQGPGVAAVQQHPASYTGQQHPAGYTAPQQHTASYAAPQQHPGPYTAPHQHAAAYAAPQPPADPYNAPQHPTAGVQAV